MAVCTLPSTYTLLLAVPTGIEVFSSAYAVTVTVTWRRRGASPSIVSLAATVRVVAS
ncbi:MAG: hypothetical protein JWP74_996 [Marmoricola sp.]|nr:hypothetical protein [Marmoricola sp.]